MTKISLNGSVPVRPVEFSKDTFPSGEQPDHEVVLSDLPHRLKVKSNNQRADYEKKTIKVIQRSLEDVRIFLKGKKVFICREDDEGLRIVGANTIEPIVNKVKNALVRALRDMQLEVVEKRKTGTSHVLQREKDEEITSQQEGIVSADTTWEFDPEDTAKSLSLLPAGAVVHIEYENYTEGSKFSKTLQFLEYDPEFDELILSPEGAISIHDDFYLRGCYVKNMRIIELLESIDSAQAEHAEIADGSSRFWLPSSKDFSFFEKLEPGTKLYIEMTKSDGVWRGVGRDTYRGQKYFHVPFHSFITGENSYFEDRRGLGFLKVGALFSHNFTLRSDDLERVSLDPFIPKCYLKWEPSDPYNFFDGIGSNNTILVQLHPGIEVDFNTFELGYVNLQAEEDDHTYLWVVDKQDVHPEYITSLYDDRVKKIRLADIKRITNTTKSHQVQKERTKERLHEGVVTWVEGVDIDSFFEGIMPGKIIYVRRKVDERSVYPVPFIRFERSEDTTWFYFRSDDRLMRHSLDELLKVSLKPFGELEYEVDELQERGLSDWKYDLENPEDLNKLPRGTVIKFEQTLGSLRFVEVCSFVGYDPRKNKVTIQNERGVLEFDPEEIVSIDILALP